MKRTLRPAIGILILGLLFTQWGRPSAAQSPGKSSLPIRPAMERRIGPSPATRGRRPAVVARKDKALSLEEAAAPLRLSLARAIRTALARNFGIQSAKIVPGIRAHETRREQATFDPSAFTDINARETVNRSASSLNQTLKSETSSQTLRSGVRQRFQTGTSYEVAAQLNRRQDNAAFAFIDPVYEPSVNFQISQNLLKNFGIGANSTPIRVAKNNEKISMEQFRAEVAQVVALVEDLYWQLVFSIQDLEVKRQSLALAKNLLERNKVQVEVGTLPRIEIIQAEASVAIRQAALIGSRRQVKDNEDRLKEAMNLTGDPRAWNTPILPTDKPALDSPIPDLMRMYRTALKNRPDYAQAKLDIENGNIQIRFAKNQLLPTLDLTGSFGLNGLDNRFNSAVTGIRDADLYNWQVGLAFEYPLGNRSAKSTLNQRKLEAARALIALKTLEQRILVEVRQARRALINGEERVKATRAARILAEKQLEVEETKYDAGVTTNYQVLRIQDDLSSTRIEETRALIGRRRALVNLNRVSGLTLKIHNVRLETLTGKAPMKSGRAPARPRPHTGPGTPAR